MKKRLLAVAMAFLLLSAQTVWGGVFANSDFFDDYEDGYYEEDDYEDDDEYFEEDDYDEYEDGFYDDSEDEYDGEDEYYGEDGYDAEDEYDGGSSNLNPDAVQIQGVRMNVNAADGKLAVAREQIANEGETGDKGVWTIFIYLCGTDLESGSGAGTSDLEEMVKGAKGDNVRFVIQTGGTSKWKNKSVHGDKIERFVVAGGKMEKVSEAPLANMGNSRTLSDFLSWGLQQYRSEHMGLIFWDHGGGCITGVCFDEKYDQDSLGVGDIDAALYENMKSSGRRFDFVGFDACLMGTVEVANVLATYADYMFCSEEMEPGSGWDYAVLGDYLVKNPDADTVSLGKSVCDGFQKACIALNDGDIVTMSVIDLSKVDQLLVDFNTFAKNMYEAGNDASNRARIVRGIENTDNFGGNNKAEGYTNMIDLGGLINSCTDIADGAAEADKALKEAVVYSVSGKDHEGASGLSTYYPLRVQGSKELAMFGKICVSPYYLSFVDRQNHSGVTGGEEYDDENWFDDEGDWYGSESGEDDYWNYLDGYSQTGESPYITFAQQPAVGEDGIFSFVLDDNGYENTAAVCAIVYGRVENNTLIELGETIDIQEDWDYGEFADAFDGYWLSLPDEQNLATYIVDETDDYLIYTAPILLNGEETNLRIRRYFDDGSVEVEGAWAGISESGSAARDVVKLKDGDRIVPVYYALNEAGEDIGEYEGGEYVVSGDTEIIYGTMLPGDYLYAFCIDDIYGDYYMTDTVEFNIDENGMVSFR